MKKIALLFTAVALLFAVSCTKDDISGIQLPENGDGARTLNVTASVNEPASNEPTSRAALEETVVDGVKTLIYKWVAGDKIQLGFVQGEVKAVVAATVTSVFSDGREASFSVAIPEGIDGDFTLYALAGPGTLSETDPSVVTLGDPSVFSAALSDQANLLSIWSKQEVTYDGETVPEISISFEHLGAIMSITVENKGDAVSLENIELAGSTAWLFNETGRATFDMDDSQFGSTGEGSSLSFNINSTLATDESVTYYRWFIPKAGTSGTVLSLKGTKQGGDEISSGDLSITTNKAFEKGWNYGLAVTVNESIGDGMIFTALPRVEIATSNAVGSTLGLVINAASGDRSNVWIDLNNNGKKDPGEDNITFDNSTRNVFEIGAQTVTIYGNLSRFECHGNATYKNNITRLIANAPKLTRLFCAINEISELDVSNCINLTALLFNQNALSGSIDLSNNKKITHLVGHTNQITEVIGLSDLTDLFQFNFTTNKLTHLDFSGNPNLDNIYAGTNQLQTITGVNYKSQLRILSFANNAVKELDVTGNTAMTSLTLTNNQFQAEALNAIFGQLVSTTTTNKVTVTGNPGASTADDSIATDKGWEVTK